MTADSKVSVSEPLELSATNWKEVINVVLLATTTFMLGLILFVRPDWLI